MPTSYEIYQTYLRGPVAVLHLFEQALGTQAIYGPPGPDTQQRTIDGLPEQIGQLKSQIARLKMELSEARGDNHRLRRRNTELEALISKDSHNSSRPPSTDPPCSRWATPCNTRSIRDKSFRRVVRFCRVYVGRRHR